MDEKTERDLTPQQRDLVARAKQALASQQHDYAITLLRGLLKAEPSVLSVRQLLRAAQIQKAKGGSSFGKSMASVQIQTMAMKVSSLVKKSPLEALDAIEEMLILDPFSAKSNGLLADAATALEMPKLASLAYETVVQGNPKDAAYMHKAAALYMQIGDFEKAEKMFARIVDIDPRDGDALSGMKNASAAGTSQTGGWNEAQSYRDVIANKDQAAKLEQESKVVKSEESINDLIQSTYAKFEAEPQNLNHSKTLAQLYEQLDDLENSVAWYQYVFDSGNGADTSLDKKIGDLTIKRLERTLAAAQDSGDAETISRLEQELQTFKLQQARDLVSKYPNEGEYHYRLGEALVAVGEYKEALPELQIGTKQPNVRIQALNLIALCHWKRGMLDLSEKAFRNTKSECIGWDALKKDVVYNLMQVLFEEARKAETDSKADLAQQKKSEAIEEAKEIYEVDLSYKNVSQIVEESYGT